MMEVFTILLNFVQTIAWPVVTLIFFAYFAGSLRELLTTVNEALMKGGIKVTTSGVEIPGPQEDIETIDDLIEMPAQFLKQHEEPARQNEADLLASQPQKLEVIIEPGASQLADEIQEAIQELLSQKEETTSEKELLEKLLCDAYINLFYERTSHKILPSQVELLHKLAEQQKHCLSLQKISDFFHKQFPQESVKVYHKWLAFLERLHFIQQSDHQVALAAAGNQFLKYLEKRGYQTKAPH
jgi:hypothetical protein